MSKIHLCVIPSLIFLLLSIPVFATSTLNSNFNFSSSSQIINGLEYFVLPVECSEFGVNYLSAYNDTLNATGYGVANIFYNSSCFKNNMKDFYILPKTDGNTTTFNGISGYVSAKIRIASKYNFTYAGGNTGSENKLMIYDIHNGTVYNYTTLPQYFALSNNTFLEYNVSYNFTTSADISIAFYEQFYYTGGSDAWLDFYVDYFKVTGTSCAPLTYCTTLTDYVTLNSTCGAVYGTCAPKECRNVYDYGLNNASSLVGVSCYNGVTYANCKDINGNTITCGTLSETLKTNALDGLILTFGGFFSISDLSTSRGLFSVIASLIVAVLIVFVISKMGHSKSMDSKVFLTVFAVIFMSLWGVFSYIGWFPAWIYGILVLLIAILTLFLIAGGK